MDYFDVDHAEHAEARRRARLARQEGARRARRKRLIAAGLIALSFAVSYAGAVVAHARRPAARPRLASRQAAPVPPVEPAAATAGKAFASPPRPRKVAPKPKRKAPVPSVGERVRIAVGSAGYEPDVVRVKSGVPITLTVGRGEGCAAGFLMPDLGISKDNSTGAITFRIRPLRPGTYRFTCGMEMVEGRLIAE